MNFCNNQTVLQSAKSAIRYSDYFDFPLTLDEIHDYMDINATKEELEHTLKISLALDGSLLHFGGYWIIGSRKSIVNSRIKRKSIANKIRIRMLRSLKLLFKLPFIQMIAITGSLAVDNCEKNSDIDLLVITEPNRVWLTRLILYFFEVFSEKKYGLKFCFNYIISYDNLKQRSNSIFTAREVVQMVPIFGISIYQKFINENLWILDHFPNLQIHKHYQRIRDKMSQYNPKAISLGSKSHKRFQRIQNNRIFTLINLIEYKRAIKKIISHYQLTVETSFSLSEYKGHFDNHQTRLNEVLNLNGK